MRYSSNIHIATTDRNTDTTAAEYGRLIHVARVRSGPMSLLKKKKKDCTRRLLKYSLATRGENIAENFAVSIIKYQMETPSFPDTFSPLNLTFK